MSVFRTPEFQAMEVGRRAGAPFARSFDRDVFEWLLALPRDTLPGDTRRVAEAIALAIANGQPVHSLPIRHRLGLGPRAFAASVDELVARNLIARDPLALVLPEDGA